MEYDELSSSGQRGVASRTMPPHYPEAYDVPPPMINGHGFPSYRHGVPAYPPDEFYADNDRQVPHYPPGRPGPYSPYFPLSPRETSNSLPHPMPCRSPRHHWRNDDQQFVPHDYDARPHRYSTHNPHRIADTVNGYRPKSAPPKRLTVSVQGRAQSVDRCCCGSCSHSHNAVDDFTPNVIDEIVAVTAEESDLSPSEHLIVKGELYRNFIRTYDALRDAIDAGQLHSVLHPVLADVIVRKTMEIDAALAEEEKNDAPEMVTNPLHFHHGAIFVHRVGLESPHTGKIVSTYAVDISTKARISTLLKKLAQITSIPAVLLRIVYQEEPLSSNKTLLSYCVEAGASLLLYVLPPNKIDGGNFGSGPPQRFKTINSPYNVTIQTPLAIQTEFLDCYDRSQRCLLGGDRMKLDDNNSNHTITMAELDAKAREREEVGVHGCRCNCPCCMAECDVPCCCTCRGAPPPTYGPIEQMSRRGEPKAPPQVRLRKPMPENSRSV